MRFLCFKQERAISVHESVVEITNKARAAFENYSKFNVSVSTPFLLTFPNRITPTTEYMYRISKSKDPMFARGLRQCIKVLKIYLRLFVCLINLKILVIRNILITIADPPILIIPDKSRIIVIQLIIVISKSNIFQRSLKYSSPFAVILMIASIKNIPEKKIFRFSTNSIEKLD
jgi:hypothetical protein